MVCLGLATLLCQFERVVLPHLLQFSLLRPSFLFLCLQECPLSVFPFAFILDTVFNP